MFSVTRARSKWVRAGRAACIAAAAVLGTYAVAAPEPTQNQPHQSPDSFAAAIRDDSSSPIYVLITVVDDATGQARTGCTMGPFLVYAIQRERRLGSDAAAGASARNIALANTSHLFHFSVPEALANVPFRYSPHDLEVARQLIRPLTDEQLRKAFSSRGELAETNSNAERDARACALVERGLWVRIDDGSGELILDQR